MTRKKSVEQHLAVIQLNKCKKLPPFWCEATGSSLEDWKELDSAEKAEAHIEADAYFTGCGIRPAPHGWIDETSNNRRRYDWMRLTDEQQIAEIQSGNGPPKYWLEATERSLDDWKELDMAGKTQARIAAAAYFVGCGTHRAPQDWIDDDSNDHRRFDWKRLTAEQQVAEMSLRAPKFWCEATGSSPADWRLLAHHLREAEIDNSKRYFDGCGIRNPPKHWVNTTSVGHRLYDWKRLTTDEQNAEIESSLAEQSLDAINMPEHWLDASSDIPKRKLRDWENLDAPGKRREVETMENLLNSGGTLNAPRKWIKKSQVGHRLFDWLILTQVEQQAQIDALVTQPIRRRVEANRSRDIFKTVNTILKKTAKIAHKLPEGQNISALFINSVADANVGGGKIAKKTRKRSKRQVVIAGKSTTNARSGLLIGADAFREPGKRSFEEADLVVLSDLPTALTFESDISRKRKKARRRNPATTTGEIANALPGPGELYTNYTGL